MRGEHALTHAGVDHHLAFGRKFHRVADEIIQDLANAIGVADQTFGHIVGHGTASGVGFRLRIVQVLKIRNGKAIWGYDIAAPSVTAAGLSE